MKQEISKFPSFNHSGKEHIINTFTSKECDKFGVDVYTVKDGLLTPDLGDVMGMLKLAMQYGMAEKTV